MPQNIDIHQILDRLKLSPNMSGADFGTGPGHWAIELARRLMDGLVYAIDIQESYLSALKGRAEQNYLNNIRLLQRDLTEPQGSGLPEASLQVIILANTLFQVEDKKAVLAEAYRVLRPRGQVLVVDWRPETPLMKRQPAVSMEEIEVLADQIGFQVTERLETDDYHFGLILKKN